MPKLTPEEVRSFISDAKKARENWLVTAERSWSEIKKRQKNGNLWSVSPNNARRPAKYPLWYSIFKIRQPIVFSRVGIPIGKDTTQDGSDNIGATAAICLERLAINLARSFNFKDVMCTVRDELLATNMGNVRAYYERKEIKEPVVERLAAQPDEVTGEMNFFDSVGNPVGPDEEISQDDQGFFRETEEVVDVEEERICLEPVVYKDGLFEPDVIRFHRMKRIAFLHKFSQRDFKAHFGAKAFATLSQDDDHLSTNSEAAQKRESIRVWEYWDKHENETVWLPEEGKDFIKPIGYGDEYDEEGEEEETRVGIYDLDGFFPMPEPLMINQPSDEFYPVPEFYQLQELIDFIHTIFSRMIALTKAIRARLLFDNNVDGLQAALNEATEGDAFGVPNLAQSLANAGGTLDAVVQYIPTEKLIQSLGNMYTALEQQLNTAYKLTGTSDLLQGFTSDASQKTYGERQLQEKYALNQISEAQDKMQEFVRASYELMVEMALRNFKDSSLERYIIPQTLPEDHKPRFPAALALLKDKRRRFRIELETDSTIALNEEFDKRMRMELVQTLTQSLEKCAGIAESNPGLLKVELHAMKFLIQGMRQGKMFQNEITAAIDAVVQQIDASAGQPVFNKDEKALQLQEQKMQIDAQIQQQKIQSDEQLEIAKLSQAQQIANLDQQFEQFKLQAAAAQEQAAQQLEVYKLQSEGSQAAQELQLAFEKTRAEIAQQQQLLQLRSDELLIQLRKLSDEKDSTQFQQMLDARVAEYEMQLGAAQQQIEQVNADLAIKERYMTEARLQQEQQLKELQAAMEMQRHRQELMMAQPQQQPAINIQMPTKQVKRKVKVSRDESGQIADFQIEEQQDQ